MKPTLAFLILVADSIQDATTSKWTHINVFNLIIIPKNLDYALQNFRVAGQLNNMSAGPSTTEIRIVDKNDKPVASSILSGTLEKGDVQFSAIFSLVRFDKVGRYYVHAYFGGKKLTDGNRYYFDVSKENA